MCHKTISVAVLAFLMASCGGGHDSPDADSGLLISASGSVGESDDVPDLFRFSASQGHAYAVTVTPVSGDPDLLVTDGSSEASTPVGMSWNFGGEPEYVSFIASSDMDVYAHVSTPSGTAIYTITATSNHLVPGGAPVAGIIHGDTAYYSFDAVEGQGYRIALTPSAGAEADLTVYSGAVTSSYSPTLEPEGIVVSSSRNGTDEVSFRAPSTGVFYMAIANSLDPDFSDFAGDATYTLGLQEVSTGPDLSVAINRVTTALGSITIDYTIANGGLSDAATFNAYFLADAASVPTASDTTGQAVAVSGLAAGRSLTGSVTLATAGTGGSAYAIVDPEAVVAEADETNNVSAGREWSAPLEGPVSFDFEDGLAPSAFTASGNAPWLIDSAVHPLDSMNSFRAGDISHGESACFAVNVAMAGATQLRYDWKVDSEIGKDFLKLFVDGAAVRAISGAQDWSAVTFTATAGTHQYKWCYLKDGDLSAGLDTGWIDNIQFAAAPPNLRVTLGNVTSDNSSVSIGYTVVNTGGEPAGASVLQLWPNLTTAPLATTTGGTLVDIPAIPVGGSFHGTTTISLRLASGTAYGAIDSPADAVVETSENDNVSAGVPWTSGTPALSYTFEDNVMPAGLTLTAFDSTGNSLTGDALWSTTGQRSVAGLYSTHSGGITDGESSCITIPSINSTGVRFDWSVSSEPSYDKLEFYVDGAPQRSISGERDWTGVLHTVAKGNHEYRWCYSKDNMASSGSDEGWVDNIVVY